MQDKDCKFEFPGTNILDIEKLLSELKCDKPCGHDKLDSRLLKLSARIVASPICYIFNLSLKEVWKVAKVTLPKNRKEEFTGSNSRPISI